MEKAMSKSNPIKKVIKFEIIRQIKKPSFWISLLLMPLLFIGLFGLSAMNNAGVEKSLSESPKSEKILGLTDESSLLKDNTNFIRYPDKEEGVTAVKDGKIDIFYHIPADFPTNPKISYYVKSNTLNLFSSDDKYIKNALTAVAVDQISPLNLTLIQGSYTTEQTTFNNAGKEVNIFGQAIIPLVILAIFYILICVFGNRLLMAVVEEKENRISEMILTSISAKNLIIGKIIALITLGTIQISIFIIPMLGLLIANLNNPAVESIIKSIELNPVIISANITLLFVSYFLFTGLSTFIGTLTPTAKDASQYFSIIVMGVISPLFFTNSFISQEPNLMTYILSYFPLSAPLALMLRNAAGLLPWYEFIGSIGMLSIYSIIIINLAIKSFQKNAINFSVVKPNFKIRSSWKKIKV